MGDGLPDWLDDIHAFLARLRGASFVIGCGEEARVLWLLNHLRLSESPPQSVQEWAHWLGPVCCTHARQQQQFADELARWAREHGNLEAEPASVQSAEAAEPAPVKALRHTAVASRWLLYAGVALMMGLVVLVALWIGDVRAPWPPASQPPVIGGGTGTATNPTAGAIPTQRIWSWVRYAVPAAVLILFLLWQRWRPQALARHFTTSTTPGRQVGLKAARRLLFAPGTLSHDFQALRRHHDVPSHRIDVGRSLRATVRAGGHVQLRYATQRRLPDYLVLVDRVSLHDHQSALADALLRRFNDEQVPCTCYDFHGDPRRARTRDGSGRVVDLADLAAIHGEHPLLLITEADRFFTGEGDRTQTWVDRLLAWPLTVILTPRPAQEWDAREKLLLAMGFVVLPATPAGIARFADLLLAGATEASTGPADTAPSPLALLTMRPDRWVRRIAPPQQDIDRLLTALQQGIGGSAFEVLCAAAVFPAVNGDVTLWLAAELGQERGALLNEESFGRLARLPWLRRGSLPDWLRLALIARLGPKREAEVRRLCLRLLKPRGAGNESFDLEIQADDRTWLATMLAALRQDESSTLRDVIFLCFVRGQKVDPLALSSPGELNRLVRPPRLGKLEWVAIVATVLATGLLWLYDLQLGELMAVAAERIAGLFALSDEAHRTLMVLGISSVLAALGMWHWAVLNDRPAPRQGWLRGARVVAVVAAGCMGLAWQGEKALFALFAGLFSMGVSWLPPRPASHGKLPVQLRNLLHAHHWALTSLGIVFVLGLYFEGCSLLLEKLINVFTENVVPTQELALANGMSLLAVALALATVVAGRPLQLNMGVAAVCGGATLAATAFCLVLYTLKLVEIRIEIVPVTFSIYKPDLTSLITASAWGLTLALWQCGRARHSWVAFSGGLAAVALLWPLGCDAVVRLLPPLMSAPVLIAVLRVLPIVAIFIWILTRHGPPAANDVTRSSTTKSHSRVALAASGLLAPLVLLDWTDEDSIYANTIWAFILPALRLARPDLFRSAARPMPEPRLLQHDWATRLFGYDLFISFAMGPPPSGTQSYASDLARQLREHGLRVFFSEDELLPGRLLTNSLRQALDRSNVLVVLLNRATLQNPRWTRIEVEMFRRRHPNRPVIPISIDGALQDPACAELRRGWLDDALEWIWLDEWGKAVEKGMASPELVKRLAITPRRSRLRRLLQHDWATRLFGYDLFISFAMGPPPSGTQSYASDLARQLREHGLRVFFSEDELLPGGLLTDSLRQALGRSNVLVVLLNRATLQNPGWMPREVEMFRRRHPNRPVIPISIDGALQDPACAELRRGWLDDALEWIWLDEWGEAVEKGMASPELVKRLAIAPLRPRSVLLWRWLVGAVLVIASSVVFAIWLLFYGLPN